MAIETVGEILHYYPSKHITIVHPAASLLDGWPKSGLKKLDKYVNDKKKGRNVTVVLGKKYVRTLEDGRHELSDGSFVQGILSFFLSLFFLSFALFSPFYFSFNVMVK